MVASHRVSGVVWKTYSSTISQWVPLNSTISRYIFLTFRAQSQTKNLREAENKAGSTEMEVAIHGGTPRSLGLWWNIPLKWMTGGIPSKPQNGCVRQIPQQ